MAKLRVVNEQPMMKDLDAKFKDDPQKLQVEKMAMYRKMGVSPFGGCLPMILQYPILISMFFFFPQSVELRQQSFLWAHDLSTYDSIWDLGFTIPMYGDHISLFTILMAISIYIYTYYNQKSQPSVNNQMKYISYFMPLIFIVFLNNYASGLSWYYFAANLISIIQTTGIRYFLDDEKLLSQLEEARKKKGGKNDKAKGKGRIEQWLERQQQKQRELSQAQRQQGKGKPSKKK
jgi:YidC/Oxa1 family membrane protein insertase